MMLPLVTTSVDTVIRDAAGPDGVMRQLSDSETVLSLVPLPLQIGLGVLVLSAMIVVALEYRHDRRRAKRYSAARF